MVGAPACPYMPGTQHLPKQALLPGSTRNTPPNSASPTCLLPRAEPNPPQRNTRISEERGSSRSTWMSELISNQLEHKQIRLQQPHVIEQHCLRQLRVVQEKPLVPTIPHAGVIVTMVK